MENLWIKETYVNETEGYRHGESPWYETFTDNLGVLFRSLQKEYGRATKMYRDLPGKDKHGNRNNEQCGWVFVKRVKYEDCNDTYVRCVWVEVVKKEPVTTTHTEMINAFNSRSYGKQTVC